MKLTTESSNQLFEAESNNAESNGGDQSADERQQRLG